MKKNKKLFPKLKQEFKADRDKKYEVKVIQDSAIYTKKAKYQLLRLYYLILYLSYSEAKNIYKYTLVVVHLLKIINIFYKNHLKKLIIILPSIDFILYIEELVRFS